MKKTVKLNNSASVWIGKGLVVLFAVWCLCALLFVVLQHIEFGATNGDDKGLDHPKHEHLSKPPVRIPETCGITDGTLVAHYGQFLDPPIYENHWRQNPGKDLQKSVERAYGCSVHRKHCFGAPQAIPCCTKIMFDIWSRFDLYLRRHGVEYSLRWGSLLFAVRNGMHMPWDGRDIDIGFMRPPNEAKRAANEFVNDYNLYLDAHEFGGHIGDVGTFYELHHEQYGYPDPVQEYCFVNGEYTTEIGEFKHPETLQLAGNCFFDFGVGTDGDGGMDSENKAGLPMIPISYDGSNGMKPPRAMYAYPDYYKHMNSWYGDWKWMDMKPDYISEQQFQVKFVSDLRSMRIYLDLFVSSSMDSTEGI